MSLKRLRAPRLATATISVATVAFVLAGSTTAAYSQVRDTTRQARDSLRRDAARRPAARGDTAVRADTARVGAAGDTTQRARGDSAPPSPYNGLRLRSIGPSLTSGRIGDIAVHPKDKKTWYVAVASGGVWKTTNAGTTWTPIFDNEASYSIGTVVIDPRNPNVIWVGTGENNAQRSVGYGDGVYKSEDGGKSWKNVGLKSSEHIGKILIHPKDSSIVYVAAQGPLWAPGGERGLYKTTDGGKTWTAALTISENTGVSDVVMDPRRLEDWVTIHDHLEDAPSGTLKKGSKLTQILRLAGRRFHVRWTVVENEPCERVVWEGRGPVGSHAKVIYQFTNSSNGDHTDFHYINEYDLPGGPLGRIAGRGVARVTQKELDATLQKLKRITE